MYFTSSRPYYLTAPNGLNFSRSVGKPTSRLEKVRKYLYTVGRATKREILRDVFGKNIVNRYITTNDVSSGWGCYLFTYGIRHGFFKKERVGNTVFYSLS